MIVTIPPRLQSFCGHFASSLSSAKQAGLAWLLASYLLTRGKRSQSALAREVLSQGRDPSSVSRRMRRESFRTRDLTREEMNRQIARELERADGKEETWFLPIDGVCLKRGGDTKVENATKYRKKRRGDKGRSTKAHAFVLGMLITPSGARIPLPRRSYYTKAYVSRRNRRIKLGREQGRPLVFQTQVDLACLMVKELDLPPNIRLVVLADEYFEGKKLNTLCRRKGYIFMAPVDSRRTLASGTGLHAHGKVLPRSSYRKLHLRRGEEDTASHRRQSPRGAGDKDQRVYRFRFERQDVAGIGEVGVVFSWKRRRERSGRLTARETFKVLVCSDPAIPGKTIIAWFEMRWQVEIYFRELKSYLGLGDYQGTDFSACERHVDLALLSFLFLEELRVQEMSRSRSPVRRRELSGLRTAGYRARLEREAYAADAAWFTQQVGRDRAPRQSQAIRPPT